MQRSISGFFLFLFFSAAARSVAPADNYTDLIRAAELSGDREQVATQCRAWYASGQYSSGALNWNYNALMSLEPDALLLTQNDNDTYPVWMLQYALGVRPDVHVLNLNLLENNDYRDLMIRQENLHFIPAGTDLDNFLRLFVSGKNTFPTYFGVMLDKNRIETAKNNLYLTGLALKFSLQPFDNVAVLRNNYENITPKTLEKSMKKVSLRIWAAETETTNAQYERFLQDLLKNRDFEQLDLCKTAATNWRSLLPDSLKNLPDAAIFPNGHPDSPEMPVQNISHEAAQHYCEWMTKVYNASTERKKFKKVLFRLPTEPEWEMAASGGLKSLAYPWGGLYIRNSKGCYLCKNEYRRQARKPAELTAAFEDNNAVWLPDTVDQQLLETQLRAAIDALQEPQRQCFILRYQEELSVREISAIIGCPEGTIKSRLHYALQKVAADLHLTWGSDTQPKLYKNLMIKYL